MSTRASTKMEEQMAALMTKIDQQNEHLWEQSEVTAPGTAAS